MASFVLMSDGHPTRGCMNLGPPLLPGMGVENDDPGNSASPMTTLNGVYELTYFRYTLGVAQQWRERRGLQPDADAARVLKSMCSPRKRRWRNESVYFFTDASTELIGNATALGQLYACAHMPCTSAGIDRETMLATLRLSVAEFDFNNAYPGDDRAYAMAAARLGDADIALEMLLKNEQTSIFNPKNGQWQGFFPLLTSSNGQLMYAVAMLAGGWDGGSFTWPSGWSVKAEGFPRLLSDDEDTDSTTAKTRTDKVAMGRGRGKVNWWLKDRTDPQDSEFVAQHSQAATGIIPCFETWQIHDDGTSSPDMSTFTGKW